MSTDSVSFTAAVAAISRLSGLPADRIVISPMTVPGDHSAFAVDASGGRLRIRASDVVAAVSAYAAYARRTGLGSVSRFGVRPISGELIEGVPIEMRCGYPIRLAHNITVGGYTTPYFDWDQWQRELDLLAASGVNTVQLTLGQEAVWLSTFQRFGYRQDELLAWIAPPSHQPWQWLNNIEHFGDGTSLDLIERRAELARQVLGRMRELGMRAVLPGFSGTVPRGFAERNPGARTIPQGKWFLDMAGPERPDWLACDTPHYDAVADAFYAEQRRLFDAGGMWAVDLLHEGGKSGGVPLAEAARGVEAGMQRADPAYTWVLQAWVGNPRRELLDAVDREHLLVIDLTGESWERLDAFDDTPWVYGILPNYGGRTSLYGDLAAIAETPAKLGRAGTRRLTGLANMAEGVGNNPVVWDLFHDVAWQRDRIELDGWLASWTAARYGTARPELREAWRILLATAYASWRGAGPAPAPAEWSTALSGTAVDAAAHAAPTGSWFPMSDNEVAGAIDGIEFEFYAGTDSVIAAVPSLRANQASTVGPRALGYPAGALVPALRLMLSGAPAELTPGFRFDLVDLARQVVDDEARRVLPALAEAADAKDLDQYDRLVALFLDGVEVQDAVLSTDENFLLGRWVADARRWGGTPDESVRLATEAKRLLTSWGYEDSFVLTEYATRSWAGLVGGYFRSRWERWFAEVRKALTAEPTTPVDWYRFAADWVEPDVEFAAVASGDPVSAATAVLGFAERVEAALRQTRFTRPETG
ncbi:alpha-N-acetylglucosaminidase [Nonomuraea sp. NPDC023979]|uniref:alpha-N-acetylglucosaminidase n=1 Tax=Nonomuraea sp. NPDC023979 TaxID=3154796 RepID=UPI0033C5D6C8